MKNQFLIFYFFLNSVWLFGQQIWAPINFPDTLYSSAINAEKEGVLFVGTGGNNKFGGLFKSYNEGETWELLQLTPYPYITTLYIKYDANGVLFVSTAYGIYRSYDDGNTFEFVSSDWASKIIISSSNEIYVVGDYIVRSSDEGNTWDTLYSYPYSQFVDIDFGQNGEIYATSKIYYGGDYKGFHRSFDNGETWEQVGIKEKGLWSVCVNSINEIIVGGYFIDSVYVSSDHGTSWIAKSQLSIDVMKLLEGDNLIAGRSINNSSGCWFSEDWGETWTSLVDTVLNPQVNQFSVSPLNTIYVQSIKDINHPQHLFKSINPILSNKDHLLSSEIKLFPNPVNNKVTISNNTSGRILSYSIYNQKGQKVKIGNSRKSEIDVSNLNSGLYIIELEFENKLLRKKIIIE